MASNQPASRDPAAPKKSSKPSLRERVDALRNLPPFLREIWATSRALTARQPRAARCVRALLPVATLYVGKLIIDEAVRLVALGHRLRHASARPGAAVSSTRCCGCSRSSSRWPSLSDLLGRLVSYGDALLSELFTNATSVRLMEHAATLDLEDFEDPDLQDKPRPRAPADDGAHEPDEPAVRPGAGRDHGGELRRRPAGVRAVADRAAGGRADSGLRRRGALQRAGLFAQLPVDAGAAPARIRAADRRQRRNREGGEDLQPPPLPDRALPRARRQVLPAPIARSRASARSGARCWPRSARSATTSPTPTSPGARCAATSASAT